MRCFRCTYLSVNINWVCCWSINFQFWFAILCNLSHKWNCLPNIFIFSSCQVIHFEESYTKRWKAMDISFVVYKLKKFWPKMFHFYLFLDSTLIAFCLWNVDRASSKSSSTSSSSSLPSSSSLGSKSLKSITIGLEKSWIRSCIKLPFSLISSSVLDDERFRVLFKFNLTRASKLWCFRDWKCFRFVANSSSDELPFNIRSRIFEFLMSSETCFFDWKARRLSSFEKFLRS